MPSPAKRAWFRLIGATFNRFSSRLARSGRGPYSLVRHVGRKTGRTYETPIVLGEVSGGFVCALAYGSDVQWFRNVKAANGCVVIHRGTEHEIVAVETVGADVALPGFGAVTRMALRALRTREFALLRTAVSE